MSQSKRLIDYDLHRQSEQLRSQNPLESHFLELSSTMANTTNMSRRSMVCGKSLHKIPKVLNKLEKNIQTLKKYCTEISREKHTKRSKKTSSKNINGQKIIGLEKLSCNVEPQVDKIKETYATTFGKPTNNIVELYNFYKHLEKSSYTNATSFSQSNNSISMAKFDCSTIGGKLEQKSLNSRQTPSLLSNKDESSVEEPSCNNIKFALKRNSDRDNGHMHIDGEEHSAILNQSGRVVSNYHNNSVVSSYDHSFRNKANIHYNCGGKKNDEMPLSKQLSNSQQDPCITLTQPEHACHIPQKRQAIKTKKRDSCDMPLQQKILRIETETDRDRPKHRNEVKKCDLNLAAELRLTDRHKSASFDVHPILKPKAQIPIEQSASPFLEKTQIKQEKTNKTQLVHQKPLPVSTNTCVLNINAINTSVPPTKTQQKWNRPASGTPHVVLRNKHPENQFVRVASSKSLEKDDNEKKSDIINTGMIYEKNMLINKRKQQINSKLKRQEKNSLNFQETGPVPNALDEAIFIESISPNNLVDKAMFLTLKEETLFDEHSELTKEKLPLSKHDLSLWENMNLVEEMHLKGQLQLKDSKQNIIAEAIEIIKKKKSFKKSKFYVEDIPKSKKMLKQVQLIDIDSFSPETIKQSVEPSKSIKKTKKNTKPNKQDSLLDCDISIGQRMDDPLLCQIENIQYDF